MKKTNDNNTIGRTYNNQFTAKKMIIIVNGSYCNNRDDYYLFRIRR